MLKLFLVFVVQNMPTSRRTTLRRNPGRTATRAKQTYAESSNTNASSTRTSNSNSGWSTENNNSPRQEGPKKSNSPTRNSPVPFIPFSKGEHVLNTFLKHSSVSKPANSDPYSIARLSAVSTTANRMVKESAFKIDNGMRYSVGDFISTISSQTDEKIITAKALTLSRRLGYRKESDVQRAMLDRAFWYTLVDNGLLDTDLWAKQREKDAALFQKLGVQYILRTLFSRIEMVDAAKEFLQAFKDLPEFMGINAKQAFGLTRVVRMGKVHYRICTGRAC